MKLLLYLFLLLWCSSLRAQAPEACIFKSFWTPFGTGTEWVRGATTVDGVTVAWWGWWCPLRSGLWEHEMQRCVVGRGCLDAQTLTSELDTAARSANPLSALRDARARYTLPPLASERAAWDQAYADALAQMQAIKPPDVLYVVGRATAADGTRPAYPFREGTRSTTSSGRAIAGQPCEPRQGYAEASGSDLWAVFGPAFDPERVTLCVKKP